VPPLDRPGFIEKARLAEAKPSPSGSNVMAGSYRALQRAATRLLAPRGNIAQGRIPRFPRNGSNQATAKESINAKSVELKWSKLDNGSGNASQDERHQMPSTPIQPSSDFSSTTYAIAHEVVRSAYGGGSVTVKEEREKLAMEQAALIHRVARVIRGNADKP
jgi:hypothetical protein